MSYLKQTTKMGVWKKHKIAKAMKRSFTKSSIARIYIAIPPAQGWPGGSNYAANGLRGRKG